MTTVDLVTTSAYPEMLDLCRWMFERQETSAELRHQIHSARSGGGNRDRHRCLADLLEGTDGDYFMLCDDDDYHSPDYIQHCLDSIGELPLYGEIPKRTYFLRKPAWGEGTDRIRLFPTFVLMRAGCRSAMVRALRDDKPNALVDWLCGDSGFKPPHSERLVIMRGLMDDTTMAVTRKKNQAEHWGQIDEGYKKLGEWVDPGAFALYVALARRKGWVTHGGG
jgi:hypothetical protein